MKRFILLLTLLAIPCFALADCDDCRDCCCQHCGCQSHCQKCCRVICEWKDVKETVYSCRCKDVCIPGPSEKGCTKYEPECPCGPQYCPIIEGPKPLYTLWCPSECAGIRNVTKLVKVEVTHKVPTYKWVVEYCCDKCRCNMAANDTGSENSPKEPAKLATSQPLAVVPISRNN